MGCTVRELLGRVSSEELTDWMAYYRLEPFGEERADLRAGIIAAVMANAMSGKSSRKFTADEFMPKFGPKPEPTPDELRTKLMAMAVAAGCRVDPKRGT